MFRNDSRWTRMTSLTSMQGTYSRHVLSRACMGVGGFLCFFSYRNWHCKKKKLKGKKENKIGSMKTVDKD